jgi:hypothetical protein
MIWRAARARQRHSPHEVGWLPLPRVCGIAALQVICVLKLAAALRIGSKSFRIRTIKSNLSGPGYLY